MAQNTQASGQAGRATPLQLDRLLVAAKRWAAFQDGDSLEDQRTDSRLQSEAIEAREALIAAIEALS